MPKQRTKADIHQALGGASGGTTVIGAGGGGTQPTTVSLDTGNSVLGGLHTHQLDIASHIANPAAHHAPVTVGNTGLSLSTQQVSLNLAAVSGLQISTGLMLDDTIAGDGLAIANKVLGIDLATNSGLLLTGTPAKLAVRTPTGSLGGTSTNAVSDAAGHSHDVATAAPSLVFGTTAAEGSGNDLVRADATLALFDATVPTTLSSASTPGTGSEGRAARRDHVHGITSYSDMSVNKGHLAKSDVDGRGKWASLTATEYLRTSLLDSEAATGLTIAPALDLYLSPGATARVRATTGVRLQADNYASQTTGWAIAYNGAADFRYVYADELHAKAFVADLEQALAGGQIISKSVAPLSRDFTAPAAGATADLWVECFEGFPDQQVFQADDVVMLRNFSRAAGSLSITNCFGTVTAPYFPDPQSDPPEQRWTFTRLTGTVNGQPAAGTMAESAVVKRGALALDFGVTGMGYHEVNAIDGMMGENSPYAQNVFWTQHPWYDRTVATRDGNLRGIFNVAGEYGLYAGDGTAAANQFVRISNEAIEAHNLPVHLYDGADITIALEPGAGAPSIAIGDPLPTGWLTQPGWWAGKDGAAYKQYVGTVSGGDLVRGAMWDGTNYHVRGNLIVGPGTGFVVEDALLHCPFDGARPYETAFDVDLSGHLGQAPTRATGGLIGRPGKFGKAVQLAEATTNLFSNPSMEIDVTTNMLYVNDGTSPTRERSALAAWIGTYGLRWVIGASPGAATRVQQQTGAAPSATAHTFSVWVKALGTAIGKAVSVHIIATGGAQGEEGGVSRFTLTGQWQLLTVTYAVVQADRTNLWARLMYDGSTPAAAGDELYIDGWQMEAKAYLTPYCDGSLGPGHAWTGTAHASTSTRAKTALIYDGCFPAGDCTVSVWAKEEALSGYCDVVRAQGDSGSFWLRYAPGYVEMRWGGEADGLAAAITRGRLWHHIVGTKQGTTAYLYYDGAMLGSHTATDLGGAATLMVGAYWDATEWLNGYVDDLLILDCAMSADEVVALYESGKPVTVTTSPMSLLLTGPGRGKVEGNASGLYGWDAGGAAAWALATEAKTFGGASLGAGDVFVGNVAQGQYLHWDDSAGKLTVRGDVAVSGSVSVAWQDITNPPDGAGRLGTGAPGAKGLWLTGSHVGYYNGSSWPVDIGNDGTFYFSKDANNYVKYDGTTFEVKGRIVVTEGTTVDSLPDGTTYGKVNKTIISGGNIQVGSGTKDSAVNGLDGWNIDSSEIVGQLDGVDQVVLGTDGKIKAGGGKVWLDKDGLNLMEGITSWSSPGALKVWSSDKSHIGFSLFTINVSDASFRTYVVARGRQDGVGLDRPAGQLYLVAADHDITNPLLASPRLSLHSTHYYGYSLIDVAADQIKIAGSITTDITATKGLNLGSATGAGTGAIRASGSIGVAIDYTPGTGNVDASGYVRGQKGLVVGDGVTAPTAASGVAFIYVDSADGDLKVKFGDGTTKTLATDT